MSVMTFASLTLGPYLGVMRRPCLPSSPSPASMAMGMLRPVMLPQGTALYPRARMNSARHEVVKAGSGSRLMGICGVGSLTAARLLAETGDIRRFHSADAFAMAAGVAPIPASSGKTQRHRLNRGGNRQLNWALYTIAFVQSRCDERARRYLARKQAEGKSWKEAIRCLKRQLARVVYRQMLADAVACELTT